MKLSTISHILTIFDTKYPRLAPKSKNHVTSSHINSQITEKKHEKKTRKKHEQPWNNHQKCIILPFFSHLFAGLRDVVRPTSRLPLAPMPAQRLHWFHHRRDKHQERQRTMGLKATIVDIIRWYDIILQYMIWYFYDIFDILWYVMIFYDTFDILWYFLCYFMIGK